MIQRDLSIETATASVNDDQPLIAPMNRTVIEYLTEFCYLRKASTLAHGYRV